MMSPEIVKQNQTGLRISPTSKKYSMTENDEAWNKMHNPSFMESADGPDTPQVEVTSPTSA